MGQPRPDGLFMLGGEARGGLFRRRCGKPYIDNIYIIDKTGVWPRSAGLLVNSVDIVNPGPCHRRTRRDNGSGGFVDYVADLPERSIEINVLREM